MSEPIELVESHWINCSHKTILPEGNYNLVLIKDEFKSVVFFRVRKGGQEIPYFYVKAYFKIPEYKS